MMKKLFFLCAFLFMSMQVYAQLYIVRTYYEAPMDNDLLDTSGSFLSYMTTCAPDGTISTIELPTASQTISTYVYASVEATEQQMQIINTELNSIINQGYKLIHTKEILATGAFVGSTYYLAVP